MSKILTDEELQQIAERASWATGKRWRYRQGEVHCEVEHGCTVGLLAYHKIPMPEMLAFFRNPADGPFVAHARQDIPALLTTVQALQVRARRWHTFAHSLARRFRESTRYWQQVQETTDAREEYIDVLEDAVADGAARVVELEGLFVDELGYGARLRGKGCKCKWCQQVRAAVAVRGE